MAAAERDFSTFVLGDDPRELAGGLLYEMASATNFYLGGELTEDKLRGFVGHIGPAKTLQDNIDLAREHVGNDGDALTIAADWVERSGVLKAVERSFVDVNWQVPDRIDVAVFNTAVGRWQQRRVEHLRAFQRSRDIYIGRVVILGGNRFMRSSEHPLVDIIAGTGGGQLTESLFAEHIAGRLVGGMGPIEVEKVTSENGDEIIRQGIELNRQRNHDPAGVTPEKSYPDILTGTVLAVGNAPAAIQVAGQLRQIASELEPSFDAGGNQLFMTAGTFPLARTTEQAADTANYQNPFTALGQIARNALYLHINKRLA